MSFRFRYDRGRSWKEEAFREDKSVLVSTAEVCFVLDEWNWNVENDDGELERNELLNEVHSIAAMNRTGLKMETKIELFKLFLSYSEL